MWLSLVLIQEYVISFQTTVTFLLKSTKLLLVDQERTNMNTINKKLKEKEMNIFVHMVQLDMLNADSEKKVCNGNSENTLVSEY